MRMLEQGKAMTNLSRWEPLAKDVMDKLALGDDPVRLEVLERALNGAALSEARWWAEILPKGPLPWRLEPRKGKHYGTHVLDANGDEVMEFWTAEGEPSIREKEYFGDWTLERWIECNSDTHWECEADLAAAERLIEASQRAI